MTRQLTLSDWQAFRELYEKQFPNPAPSPTQACVVAEQVDGEIVGFVTVRYVPVVELWVNPEHRAGIHVIEKLLAKMRTLFKAAQYFGFTKSQKLCRVYGMAGMQNEGTVFSLRGDSDGLYYGRRHSADSTTVAGGIGHAE